MIRCSFSLRFADRYIAQPYWPEMNALIDVQKKCGMNRARSEANRNKSLEEWLRANGKTLDWYRKLEADAVRPFYTDENGAIVIPPHQIYGFLVATADEARAAFKPCDPDQVRVAFRNVTPWSTGKRKADGVWERFAVVTAGHGSKISNQRGFRSSQYIENFTASGSFDLDLEFVRPEVVKKAIEWGGLRVGIGASRKMGCGRFELATWETRKHGE